MSALPQITDVGRHIQVSILLSVYAFHVDILTSTIETTKWGQCWTDRRISTSSRSSLARFAIPLVVPKAHANKLSDAFLQALADDFEAHGKGVVEKVRTERPQDYLKIVASVMPKLMEVEDVAPPRRAADLSDDELAAIIAGPKLTCCIRFIEIPSSRTLSLTRGRPTIQKTEFLDAYAPGRSAAGNIKASRPTKH